MQCRTADYFEVDLQRGRRPELRHDALVLGLSLLTERHRLPRLRLRRLWLEQLADDYRLPGPIFLDIKEPDPSFVEEAVAEMRRLELAAGAIAACEHWAVLDRLAEVGPEIRRFYGIPRRRSGRTRLTAYLERAVRGQGGAGASLPRRFANAASLDAIRQAGLRPLIWHVDDYADGLRLMEAGPVGLITHKPPLIDAWRRRLDAQPATG